MRRRGLRRSPAYTASRKVQAAMKASLLVVVKVEPTGVPMTTTAKPPATATLAPNRAATRSAGTAPAISPATTGSSRKPEPWGSTPATAWKTRRGPILDRGDEEDGKMRTRVIACGVVGGVLALIASVVALLMGGADTAIVGAWVTVAAAVLGIAGGAVAGARPGLAALLMGLAFVLAGLVAPGVLPAIADTTVVLFGYFAALALLLAGAILAFRDRRRARPGG